MTDPNQPPAPPAPPAPAPPAPTAPAPTPGAPPPAPAVPAPTVQAPSQTPAAQAGGKGPKPPTIPTKTKRSAVTTAAQGANQDGRLTLDEGGSSYEENLLKLLNKDLVVAQHDREMAVALMQVHLDRAEVLDEMPLSMPVASVISDNTGATLKALELSMKAGERLHKAAELLVKAKGADDKALLDLLKHQLAEKKLKGEDDGSWGDTSDLPGG